MGNGPNPRPLPETGRGALQNHGEGRIGSRSKRRTGQRVACANVRRGVRSKDDGSLGTRSMAD